MNRSKNPPISKLTLGLRSGDLKFSKCCFAVRQSSLLLLTGAALWFIGGAGLAQSTVSISIDRSSPLGVSHYKSAVSLIDSNLNAEGNDVTAVKNARSLLASGISFGNSHIMAWGTENPWPDPAAAGPTKWSSLDERLRILVDAGCTPILTLCEAPWWMKGEQLHDGSTRLIPDARGEWAPQKYSTAFTDFRGVKYAAGYTSPDPYGCRVLDSQMSKWLLLVQRIAERYMVAPYNVRHFQVWNELKGYYNPLLNRWQYEKNAGNPLGYHADHGYTYMYNKVYERLMSVANALGIAAGTISVGGPYPEMFSGAKADTMSDPSSVRGPWGVLDQRPLDVIHYWLANKTGAGFICMDGNNGNTFDGEITNAFTRCEKFSAINRWIRTQPNGATLPIVWSEWYSEADVSGDNALDNALGCYAAIQQLTSGAAMTLLWGGEFASGARPPLWTSTSQFGGGRPTPWFYSFQALNDSFGEGTPFFRTVSSSPNIAVLAGATKTMLVNKSVNAVAVVVDGLHVSLGRYEVKIVNAPSN